MRGRKRAGIATLVVSAGFLALAGCAPTTPKLASKSPLSLDFVWPAPKAPALEPPWEGSPTPPKAVIVQWNPKVYSTEEIAEIAGQQCATFDDRAVATRGGSLGGERSERYSCAPATSMVGQKPPMPRHG